MQQSYATPWGRLCEGVRAVLSNADTDATKELYADLRSETVSVRRSINSNPNSRGHAPEVLVMNWDRPKRMARR